MERRRLLSIAGFNLPSNVRAYLLIPDTDTNDITVQHDLGVTPDTAILLDMGDINRAIQSCGTMQYVFYNDDKSNYFRNIISLSNAPNAGYYQTAASLSECTNTYVRFGPGQYYGITWRANRAILCVIVSHDNT